MNISLYKLAKETGLSQARLWQIIRREYWFYWLFTPCVFTRSLSQS